MFDNDPDTMPLAPETTSAVPCTRLPAIFLTEYDWGTDPALADTETPPVAAPKMTMTSNTIRIPLQRFICYDSLNYENYIILKKITNFKKNQ